LAADVTVFIAAEASADRLQPAAKGAASEHDALNQFYDGYLAVMDIDRRVLSLKGLPHF
jgi:hypothetical protein